MSRTKEVFKPLEKGKVKVFSCGPSIYRRPHIGNYRTFLYEDLIIKYFEYLGYKVNHSTILTDIEDKTIIEARKAKKKIDSLTGDVAKIFSRESKLLKINLPDPIPAASTSVKQAAKLIKKLLESGHAYRFDSDIFFDPLKFKGFGKLFRLDMSGWPKKKVRFKRDTYNGRRWNRGDFILWHGYREGDIAYWDTEIGKGRPSWNIQDPSVVTEKLGYRIDISCGGIDNIFRHHDYNIAIIESVSGENYANYYMHGEHLIVNGKSMSKSRGNILYPEDVLKNKRMAHHLRFFLLYTHYRKKLNFTDARYNKACEYLNAIRLLARDLTSHGKMSGKANENSLSLLNRIKDDFEKSMNDDLGFGSAIDKLYKNMQELKVLKEKGFLDSAATIRLEKILRKIDDTAGVIF